MAEYIKRESLIKHLKQFAPESYSELINQLILKELAADVVPVVHGHWKGVVRPVFHGYDDFDNPIYHDVTVWHCSICGRRTVIKEKYCPNCGAKTDGGDDNETN